MNIENFSRINTVYFEVALVAFLLGFGLTYNLTGNKNKSNDCSSCTSSTTSAVAKNASDSAEGDEENMDCNVIGVQVHGMLVTYKGIDTGDSGLFSSNDQTTADSVYYAVKNANEDKKIKAVMVEVDSSGGMGEAGEEMMKAFQQSNKPVIAFIRSRGASAAYLAATGADIIFASRLSDVGSIGVNGSYLDNTLKNAKEGLTYIDLTAGKFKSMGDPDKPLTTEEKALILRDLNLNHEYLIELVAKNRKMDINTVKQLADGSSMTGDAALKNGLVDKIGDIFDVEKYVKDKIGEDVEVCW